jgi:BirA family transcriptional regulator, biotin operon repressor / biotin---[acetyl-CoA-carboxylase] ligase
MMKGEILKILREAKAVVSGEVLSADLGVSRVSVWKHIQKLQQLGYFIDSVATGYRLRGEPDTPFPWEFPLREKSIHYFPEMASTMDRARQMARNQCPTYTVVIAGEQEKGRGRLKRFWDSSLGGLYFTVVLRVPLPPVHGFRLNFAACVVLANVLKQMFRIDACVKWPNDILVDGKKICGMLSEMEAEGDLLNYFNIGIGINVNNEPGPLAPNAISLKQILGRQVSRKELLAGFLDQLEIRMDTGTLDNVVTEWKKVAVTLGRHVRIVTTRDELQGMARDVDDNGALVLELADGSIRRIVYGDCFHT